MLRPVLTEAVAKRMESMELTVESLIGELGLELVSGQRVGTGARALGAQHRAAGPHAVAERRRAAADDGPAARGPEGPARVSSSGSPSTTSPALGFGTGFRHKRVPAALVKAARKRGFPLFEVPYELPFIAITERAFAQLLDERYELLQRNMVGDVLAEALTGHLYPEDLQARLRPFGIGERSRCWRSRSRTRAPPRPPLERAARGRADGNLVAIRGGLLCAVIDAGEARRRGARPGRARGARARRAERALRRGARRRQPRRARRTRCG